MPLRLGLHKTQRTAVKLDAKNKQLIGELGNNSRTPLTELSRKLKINRDTLAYRIKKLQEGVIDRLYTDIDLPALEHIEFHVFLFIDESNDERVQKLVDELEKNNRTIALATYNDKWDLEWVLTAKNHETFDRALRKLFTQFSDIIIEKEILVVIKDYYTTLTPFQKFDAEYSTYTKDLVPIDQKDYDILSYLATDARINAVAIASKIGLGVDATIRRIKKLTQTRVIKSFTIQLNRYKLNQNEYAFLIQMRTFGDQEENKFKEFVKQHPYINQAQKVLGQWDLLLHITGTISEYHTTVKDIKKMFRENIKTYDSWTMYAEKIITPLPAIVKENLF